MVYLYGASGHGKVILEILELNETPFGGFLDDNPLAKIENQIVNSFPGNYLADKDELIISIGDNFNRKLVSRKIIARYTTAIHPLSIVSQKTIINSGTVIMAGAVINPDTQIGFHCIINSQSSVDHDCRIDDFVHIGPGAVLCGGIEVGEGTLIGAGSVIIPSIKVGKNSIIAAGSVVTKNVPDSVLVAGNPARIIKTLK